jgi:hypothetical protein
MYEELYIEILNLNELLYLPSHPNEKRIQVKYVKDWHN